MRLIDADKLDFGIVKYMGEFCHVPLADIISGWKKIVDAQPTVYGIDEGWIMCSKQLPEEPEEIPTEDEPVEEMILDGKFKEYIVMIWGAAEATTLYYIGNNEWYDGISGETYYKPIAWQPMPKFYGA